VTPAVAIVGRNGGGPWSVAIRGVAPCGTSRAIVPRFWLLAIAAAGTRLAPLRLIIGTPLPGRRP
jgi:hypothetical protein